MGVCVWIQVNLSLNITFMHKSTFPLQSKVNVTVHKHFTVKLSSADRCCKHVLRNGSEDKSTFLSHKCLKVISWLSTHQ